MYRSQQTTQSVFVSSLGWSLEPTFLVQHRCWGCTKTFPLLYICCSIKNTSRARLICQLADISQIGLSKIYWCQSLIWTTLYFRGCLVNNRYDNELSVQFTVSVHWCSVILDGKVYCSTVMYPASVNFDGSLEKICVYLPIFANCCFQTFITVLGPKIRLGLLAQNTSATDRTWTELETDSKACIGLKLMNS